MCGICGFLALKSSNLSNSREVVSRMTTALHHRGPDDGGEWLGEKGTIALGHRRLSILDLSAAGHQPMLSHSKRFVVVLNGEIYNHMALRAELELKGAIAWRGHSDTETLLEAVEQWGARGALQRAVGMFAMALWDTKKHELLLARDRMGEKPLYYGWSHGAFLFASELKAFHMFPGFNPEIDPDALALYFSFGYVPAPRSIYKNIYKLMPGTMLTVPLTGRHTAETYWSLDDVFRRPLFNGSLQDAENEVERLLTAATNLQSIADVPLGAFLSGGVDSSTVVALMQRGASRPVRTFAIGFEEEPYNEAPYAAAVAKHLGTDHTEMIVTSADAIALIPRLSEIWDEPFADSSEIPTAIVAALAKQKVTVSLSGDGGDELFCGYERYFTSQLIENMPAKRLLRGLLNHVPHWWIAATANAIPLQMTREITVRRLASLGHLLCSNKPRDRYIAHVMQWRDAKDLVRHSNISPFELTDFSPPERTEYLNYISGIDAGTYLPDDILVKVDRAGMAFGLETRVPILDHRLVELAFSLPISFKVRGGQTKWPLRQILYKHVPRALIDRPKRGFGVPIADWLRGPLRQWADDLLSPRELAKSGVLNPKPIRETWNQHLAGNQNWESRLWSILAFQSWNSRYAR